MREKAHITLSRGSLLTGLIIFYVMKKTIEK